MRYVIVYTNGKTVLGNYVYCLANRVNIFLQENVPMVAPTSPMRVSTVGSVTKSVLSFVINFIHVGNCWI